MFLVPFYTRLDECLNDAVGRYHVVSYANANFLQLFLCERFGALSPIPVKFKPTKPQKIVIDGVEKNKTSHLKP